MFSARTNREPVSAELPDDSDAQERAESRRAEIAAATIAHLAQQLLDWVEPLNLGVVLGPDAGMRTGVAFVSLGRLKNRSFWGKPPVPDLVVSVGPEPGSHEAMTRQMHRWLDRGVEVCVLIETWAKTVSIFRSGEVETCGNWQVLSLPDVLPGWELQLAHL